MERQLSKKKDLSKGRGILAISTNIINNEKDFIRKDKDFSKVVNFITVNL